MNKFRQVIPFFTRYRWRIAVGLLFVVGITATEFTIPLLIKRALDALVGPDALAADQRLGYVTETIVLVFAIALAASVFRFAQRWYVVGASRRAERDMKNAIFNHLVTLDPPFFNRMRSGDILARATSDVEAIRMFLGPGLMYIAKPILALPLAAIILMNEAPPWVFGTVVLPLVLLAVLMRTMSPRLERHSREVQEGLADISDRAQENFSGTRVIKAFHREDREIEAFRTLCDDYREKNLDFARARGLLTAWLSTSKDLAALLILAVGGIAMLDAQFSFGTYFLFTSYIAQLYWPLIAIGWWLGMYHRAAVSATRLNELFDARAAVVWPEPARQNGVERRGRITIRDLDFAYTDDGPPRLRGIDLEIPGGSSLGIVGKTGAGKSTLLHILGRLYPVPRGRIAIDGIDLNDWPQGELRDLFGFVPQDSFLFADTIRANLEFGRDTPPDMEEVVRVAELAHMAREIDGFPLGYDSLVGERGITLSGGQRQRMCIARALLKDPKVLVFDDSLSAVDTSTEAELLQSLRTASRGRTTIIVAHRLSSVMECDQIVVMEEGRIVERGTHATLLQQPGWYAETWTRQRLEGELEEL